MAEGDATIVDVFWRRVVETPDRAAIMFKTDGKYKSLPWNEHGKIVANLSAALIKNGIAPGDKIGILCQNRPHWTWADVAILSTQAVTIPVYPTLSGSEVTYVLDNSEVVIVFVENARQLEKLSSPEAPLPEKLRLAVVMDGTPGTAEPMLEVRTWDQFLAEGADYLKEHEEDVLKRRKVDADSLATIVYTSGTTGLPKGAMLLHKNIFSVLDSLSTLIPFNENDVALSFLPLAHVYERVGGQFLSIFLGIPFAYAESMEQVANNLQEVRPTFLNAVPRFYEKVYARVWGQIRQMPPAQQGFVRWAISLGKRACKQKMAAQPADTSLLDQLYRAELRIAERLVFRKIRERFGGRLRMMTSGAAPLANDVHLFFEAIGMPIVEGYGLTETCAPLSCNTPADNKFKTVGKPLPGVEVKLAADGELLVRGSNVFAGYYKNEEATKQAFEDGWFKTGDIAKIDEEGYIYITDRKKDIIITAGGKHVAPQFIENLFKDEPLITHVLAYGDRRKYITGLITLNSEALQSFAKEKSIKVKDASELCQHPTVRKEIERLVHEKNQNLARFQRIKKFVILDKEFSIEGNELTPTLKVKRKVVTEKYQDLLDGMYESEDLEAQHAEVEN